MEPVESQGTEPDSTSPQPPGRVAQAWGVLRGRYMTDVALQAEWLEYKQVFTDILTRFGAQLARQAKYEKERVKRELEEEETPTPTFDPHSRKVELYRRANALRAGNNFRRPST